MKIFERGIKYGVRHKNAMFLKEKTYQGKNVMK